MQKLIGLRVGQMMQQAKTNNAVKSAIRTSGQLLGATDLEHASISKSSICGENVFRIGINATIVNIIWQPV